MKSVSAIIRYLCVWSALPLLTLFVQVRPGRAAEHPLSLRGPAAEAGLRAETGFAGTPDGEGVLRRYALELPPFDEAVYWAAYQKYE